ncbi:MAG: hypothetical protein CHACPFDD_01062 [Phycisphaerae bacterium]|nr:hypothetical protein [Phycisphaerae bacterium]
MRKYLGILILGAVTTAAYGQLSENFNSGIPATWAIVDLLGGGAVSPFNWTTNNLEGRANWTPAADPGPNDLAAHADSDHHAGNFDIALVSPSFTVPGSNAKLDYDTNYQNFALIDDAETEISTNGGATWTSLLHWQEDHGTFQGWPGVHVQLDLSAYAGQTAQIRFHYYEPVSGGFDWWWQVDNVSVTPEPASMGLLGLGALALIRRRR